MTCHVIKMEKVYVPRLGFTVALSFLRQAIAESIRELGYNKPTPDQEESVLSFVSGRDVFISLPTGSGKSVCFACTPLVFDKLRGLIVNKKFSGSAMTIIVSPLNALMQDQVVKFSSRGLKAAFIGNEQGKCLVQEKVMSGCIQLLYFSPEALLSMPFWREMLMSPCYQENIVCLAVDEAHLVEKWYVYNILILCSYLTVVNFCIGGTNFVLTLPTLERYVHCYQRIQI